MLTPNGVLFQFFNSLGPAITIGYIVGRSGNPRTGLGALLLQLQGSIDN
jgi:hypothetical protein